MPRVETFTIPRLKDVCVILNASGIPNDIEISFVLTSANEQISRTRHLDPQRLTAAERTNLRNVLTSILNHIRADEAV